MHFYNDGAQRILQGQLTDHLAFYGLPLYPYLLAFFYGIFGYSPFVPAFFQACLDAGTAVLLYKIAARVFADAGAPASTMPWPGTSTTGIRGQVIGFGAAAGWALFVPAQAYSIILMPTAWLVFVLWFIVWRIVRVDHAPSPRACLLYGLLIGITAMGIATIFFAVPLVVAALVLRNSRNSGGGGELVRKIAGAALLFAGIAVGTSPCWLHNRYVARDPVFLSAHSGINFWIGNNPVANGYPRIPPGLRAGQAAMLQDSISVAEQAAGHPLKRSAVSEYWSEKANSYVAANPGASLQLVGRKLRNFWNAFQYDDLSIITSLREQAIVLPGPSFGLAAALGLPGMLLAIAALRRSRWVAAAVVLHMASLLMVFVTERYRLAAIPGLLLFAAFALVVLWDYCARAQFLKAGAVLAGVAASTLFVSIPSRDPALWALDAYNSGWQALESGDLDRAQQKLELAYSYVRDNAEINLALGNLWLQRGDREKARHFYRSTLALTPDHRSALNNLGVLALEDEQWDEAVRFFQAAIEVEPRHAKSHYLLARAFVGQGQRERALSEVEAAVALEPGQPDFIALREAIQRP
jgi:tetratricopeptide (TPR) repeat protein